MYLPQRALHINELIFLKIDAPSFSFCNLATENWPQVCCYNNYSQYYICISGDFRVSQFFSHMSEKLIYVQILYNASRKDALRGATPQNL